MREWQLTSMRADHVTLQSNYPFPAEPWRRAVHSGQRTSHHLVVYYAVTVHVGSTETEATRNGEIGGNTSGSALSGENADEAGRVKLSVDECDAAVWVVGDCGARICKIHCIAEVTLFSALSA